MKYGAMEIPVVAADIGSGTAEVASGANTTQDGKNCMTNRGNNILCIGGAADGKMIWYIGRNPIVNRDQYILTRVDGVEVYALHGMGVEAIRKALELHK